MNKSFQWKGDAHHEFFRPTSERGKPYKEGIDPNGLDKKDRKIMTKVHEKQTYGREEDAWKEVWD